MVNNVGRVYTKAGALVATFSLDSFFGVPPAADITADPRLIYDGISGRYFATYIDRDQLDGRGDLFLAVSQTNDPTGAWKNYSTSFPLFWPDYPGIGVTDDKFTISYNLYGVYTGTLRGEQTLVVQKSDVLAGISGPQVGVAFSSIDLNRFTVRPAQSLTSISDQYLTTFDYSTGDRALLLAMKITVIRITGTPNAGNVTEASALNLPITAQYRPNPSVTAGAADCFIREQTLNDLGPPPCIDSGDGRMLESVWRDNKLWSAASAGCRPSGDTSDRSCSHLIEVITAGTPSVAQDMLFGGPAGENYSWPAVTTDAAGNLYVSMTHTNSGIFAEARIAGRLASDPLNTMSGSILLRTGNVVHTSGRWGDYLGAAVDPSDPSCVWVVGEYAKNTSGAKWGTYIAETSLTGGCGAGGTATPTPTPSRTPTPTRTGMPTPTRTPTPPAAGSPIVSISSAGRAVGQSGKVSLQAHEIPAPGLGAWDIDVHYDPALVAPDSCVINTGSGACNTQFAANTVRISGASASGLLGDSFLASITFRCVAAGSSGLDLDLAILRDATLGAPQPISASAVNGTFSCTQGGLAGDVDCNGRVDPIDATLILQLDAAIIASVLCPQNADVNNSGGITAVDALLILQYVAGIVPGL